MKCIKIKVYIFFLAFILAACAGKDIVITGARYDAEYDQTTYILKPYGDVIFPGKWTKSHYNPSSTQQFFIRNTDSATFAVTKAEKTFYSFYVKGQSDREFINAFYKWESDYMLQQGHTVEKIKQDTITNYVTWHVTTKAGVENYFLYGCKTNRVYNLLMSADKMSGIEITRFLEKVYRTN